MNNKQNPLSIEEIAALKKWMELGGLSGKASASKFDVTERALRKWLAGGGMHPKQRVLVLKAIRSKPQPETYSAPEWTHLCAFRYALGRMSYIVSDCVMWLEKDWLKLSPKTRKLIHRELKEAVEDHHQQRSDPNRSEALKGITRLGHDCDAKMWIALLEKIDKMEETHVR